MKKPLSVLRTGQQGVVLSWDGIKIGMDLFLSSCEGRLLGNVIEDSQICQLDYLFGTHDHDDHIDREAWKQIAELAPHIRFVAPAYFADTLPGELGIDPERFVFCEENRPVELAPGIKVQTVAAAHEVLVRNEHGHSAAVIYLLDVGPYRICHMGDTCRYEGLLPKLQSFAPIDLLFPPINGRCAVRYRAGCIGNMTYQEAVDLTGELQPRLAIPGHYDMFAHNGEDPQKFVDYLKIKYPACKARILDAGEIMLYPKERDDV